MSFVSVTASPDAVVLPSLTIYDEDATTIYANALAQAKTLFPDWTPQEGDSAVTFLEVFSAIAAETVFTINRLPENILQCLLTLIGIQPSQGVQSSASVTFTAADSLGHTVPAGTLLQLPLNGSAYNFTTDADCVISTGLTTGTIGITCTAYTAAPNNTQTGTALNPSMQAGGFINSVVLASPITGGQDPETTQQWESRGAQAFQTLSSVLVTPVQFQQEALTNPSVFRCTAINNWNPAANGGLGASATGYVNVVVYGQGGASCTPQVMSDLEAELEAMGQVNLSVAVTAPAIVTVNITTTVQRQAGWTDSQVQANVQNALAAYLSTDTWLWDNQVRYNKLIDVIESAQGCDFVVSMTVNGTMGDIALSGVATLAKLGTATVTVNDPPSSVTGTTTVNVAATVTKSSSTDSAVSAAVTSAINTYLTTAIAAGLVRYSSLIRVISQVAAVSDVTNVFINGQAGDLTVTPAAASLGTVTITMAN